MSLEKDSLRKAAGLPFEVKINKLFVKNAAGLPVEVKINELVENKLFEGDISQIRTMDIEAELLRIFSNTIKDIKRIKDLMEGIPSPYSYSYGYGNINHTSNSFKLKDEHGEIDKNYLFKLSMDKLDIIEEVMIECFSSKKENFKDEEEYSDEDEDDFEDEDEYNNEEDY